MIPARYIALLLLTACAMPIASAQTEDAAAERARLADQRILAESERRRKAEEEARRQAAAAQAATAPAGTMAVPTTIPDSDGAASPPSTAPPATATIVLDENDAAIVRLLHHIRSLGELRDAGYVSDEEFESIKRKILDTAL